MLLVMYELWISSLFHSCELNDVARPALRSKMFVFDHVM